MSRLISRISGFRRRSPRLFRATLVAGTLAASFCVSLPVFAWTLACRKGGCPSIDSLEEYTPRQTSKLYAADNTFITEIGLERRTLIPLDSVPERVRMAFLVTEDKRFYSHSGIDWRRAVGAALRNIREMRFAQGFSTISMQLARNVFPEKLSREKTIPRKIKELKVALAIERRYEKDRIFELYLNQIFFGNGAYGVETAAQRYFGKSPRDLNIAEAAMLAGLPKAPVGYNPRRNPDRAIGRRNDVIDLMRNNDAITDAEASLAKAYPLLLAHPSVSGEVAPYFVEWVRRQLESRYGNSLYERGLKVYTTVDLEMQDAAERALERQLRWIEANGAGPYKHTTFEQYLARDAAGGETAPNSPYLQGAFLAIDPRNGAVRVMVGGRSFDDSKFNRITQALRQAGSTFKPIVYSDAIRNGRPPSFVVDDSPIEVPQLTGDAWTPQNYDLLFEGKMTIREALLRSRNVATVNLGMELGEASVVDMARRFGISTRILPVPSIHIGAASVHPLEMIAAYTVFATLGDRTEPFGIVRVESADGEVLWEPTPRRTSVLSPEEAWLMVDILKDVVRSPRGTAISAVRGRGFTIPAGGKTGTTNDGNDVWYIGFTPDLVAGVWMGMDRPQPIKAKATGGVLAAPAWTLFMQEVYSKRNTPSDWPRPAGVVSRTVDATTGMLSTAYCPIGDVVVEFFLAGTEPLRECNVHGYMNYGRIDTTAAHRDNRSSLREDHDGALKRRR
jgi:penicillin-binding protein 1A